MLYFSTESDAILVTYSIAKKNISRHRNMVTGVFKFCVKSLALQRLGDKDDLKNPIRVITIHNIFSIHLNLLLLVLIGKSSTGMDENIGALVAILFGWVSGIVMFLIEKESKFVKFYGSY